MLEYILTQLFNGLGYGMILILTSIGLTIIFGMLGIINFAHGEFLLVGAYIGLTIYRVTGSYIVALVLTTACTAFIGLILEKFILSRIYNKDVFLQFLLTFAFAEIIRESVQVVWGRQGLHFPWPEWANGIVEFGFLTYPKSRLIIMGFSALMIGLVTILLNYSNIGLIIKGATMDREMVDILGINISRIYTLVFAIGAGLAGFAGGLLGPLRSAYPALGIETIQTAFVVIVVGGLGSFKGTVLSGIIIGEVVTFTSVVYSPASEIVAFMFMAAVLLVKPRGFWGEAGFHTK